MADAEKQSPVSFKSIWPPSDRTREAVRNRVVKTLTTPSSRMSDLSKIYGSIPLEEATDAAKLIEQDAFDVATKAATADDDGTESLKVYCKGLSNLCLQTVKARSGNSAAAPVEEDVGSNAPPQSPVIE